MSFPTRFQQSRFNRDRAQKLGKANRVHGATKKGSPLHTTWNTWRGMKERCSNPKHVGYRNYGARGIAFDPRWSDFAEFLADMGPRPEGMTLDRIDPDGDYGPSNCRWADPITQRLNRRKTK